MSVQKVYEVKMTDQGRIVVPQKLRRELNLDTSAAFVMYRDGDRVVLERRGEARARLANLAAKLPGTDAFLAERRAEARREQE